MAQVPNTVAATQAALEADIQDEVGTQYGISVRAFSGDPKTSFVGVTHIGPERDDAAFMQAVRDLVRNKWGTTLHTDDSSTFLGEGNYRQNRINVVAKQHGVW